MTTFSPCPTAKAAALLLFALSLPPIPGFSQTLPPGFREVLIKDLGVLPAMPTSCDKKTLRRSLDDLHFACVVKQGGKRAVSRDGVVGTTTYDAVDSVLFSGDGLHLAFSARRGKNRLVVLDGVEQTPYALVEDLVFSPDSQHLAYRASRAPYPGKWMMIVDGVTQSDEFVDLTRPNFSPDSKVLSSIGCKVGSCTVLVGEQESEPLLAAGNVWFGQSGHHYAYAAARRVPGRGYNVFVATDQHRWDVSVDPVTAYVSLGGDTVSASAQALATRLPRLFLSSDGEHVAWVEQGKLMRDGQEGPPCEDLMEVEFSGDGNHVAWVSTGKLKWTLFLDGKSIAEFDRKVGMGFFVLPTFSPDGQRFAYFASRNTGPAGSERKVAWVPRRAFRLVLDGRELEEIVGGIVVSLRFSPDGRRLAYGVGYVGDTPKGMIVLDGQNGKPYEITGPFTFVDNNTITYRAREGTKSYQVTHTVP
jgi:hypothetical protein